MILSCPCLKAGARTSCPAPWVGHLTLKIEMMLSFFRLACAVFLLSACLSSQADDLALKIDHETTSLSADGVTRITRFSERLVRRDQQSWLARIIPAGAHEETDHKAGGKSHKHMDVNAASRWVIQAADGKLRVRIVNDHEKLVVDVPATDYGNVGFDGRWSTANQLIDPAQLQRMKASSRQAPAGTRWYEGGGRDNRVWLLWDEKAQYPRRIESSNARGTQSSLMVVTREPMPDRLPWTGLEAYAQKEYADLLD